jgi:hypothetical protein
VVEAMRTRGLDPCVVVQTSPGHLQAWLHPAPRRGSRPWPPLPASGWHARMAAIRPAPTGVAWEGSPASPIRNRRGAHLAVTRPG